MFDFALLPFVAFCLVATGTPGPNNMINMAQGVRVGFWRALPFALGAGLGLASLLVAVALGLGAAFEAAPGLRLAMKVATLGFLLYLAWRIAAAGPLRATGDARGLGFAYGAAFQWINPKTWAAAMTLATTYLPPEPSLSSALAAGALFGLTSWTTQPLWIAFGEAMRRFLADARRAKMFNLAMAAILLAATLPSLLLGA